MCKVYERGSGGSGAETPDLGREVKWGFYMR
jgi:hypothetical protein